MSQRQHCDNPPRAAGRVGAPQANPGTTAATRRWGASLSKRNPHVAEGPLIVGAGPTGLAAALFLAEKGVKARLIDAAPAPEQQSRALAINTRTLDLLAPSGVANALESEGRRLRGVRFYQDWTEVAELRFRERRMIALPQTRTEAILRAALARHGLAPERGVRFEALAQDGAGVVATLAHEDGQREKARAPILLGADGAHSRVRAALGIGFPGSAVPEAWPLCDIALDTPLGPDVAHVCFQKRGLIFMLALTPGVWRAFGNLPDLLDRLPPGTRTGATLWRSSFHISHRIAIREVRGRVALAGDAAHLHSPVGARGMNLGIEDAYVFAACAAEALAGRPGRLDEYGRLRRLTHEQVVGRVRALTTFARGRPAPLGALRPWLLPLALRCPPLARALRDTLTGLDHPARAH
nr:FAD-dependent monooxygenase [Rhodoblastus acidophilus]